MDTETGPAHHPSHPPPRLPTHTPGLRIQGTSVSVHEPGTGYDSALNSNWFQTPASGSNTSPSNQDSAVSLDQAPAAIPAYLREVALEISKLLGQLAGTDDVYMGVWCANHPHQHRPNAELEVVLGAHMHLAVRLEEWQYKVTLPGPGVKWGGITEAYVECCKTHGHLAETIRAWLPTISCEDGELCVNMSYHLLNLDRIIMDMDEHIKLLAKRSGLVRDVIDEIKAPLYNSSPVARVIELTEEAMAGVPDNRDTLENVRKGVMLFNQVAVDCTAIGAMWATNAVVVEQLRFGVHLLDVLLATFMLPDLDKLLAATRGTYDNIAVRRVVANAEESRRSFLAKAGEGALLRGLTQPTGGYADYGRRFRLKTVTEKR